MSWNPSELNEWTFEQLVDHLGALQKEIHSSGSVAEYAGDFGLKALKLYESGMTSIGVNLSTPVSLRDDVKTNSRKEWNKIWKELYCLYCPTLTVSRDPRIHLAFTVAFSSAQVYRLKKNYRNQPQALAPEDEAKRRAEELEKKVAADSRVDNVDTSTPQAASSAASRGCGGCFTSALDEVRKKVGEELKQYS